MTDTLTFLSRKQGLYLEDTLTKGRGLFCTDDIVADEELEVTPAIILNEQDNEHAEETILNDYVFTTGKISKALRDKHQIKKMGRTSCVVMGIASYCNHDEEPNAQVVWQESNGSLYYVLQATRDIPAGTEICTSYGEGWFETR